MRRVCVCVACEVWSYISYIFARGIRGRVHGTRASVVHMDNRTARDDATRRGVWRGVACGCGVGCPGAISGMWSGSNNAAPGSS